MSKTIKQIADELGVSKQAVYKRATNKLKTVLEPYVFKEYNYTCFRDEGVELIKRDFEENPCATARETVSKSSANTADNSVSHTEHVHTVSASNTPSHTEQIRNISETDTPVDTEHIQNTPGAHTDYIRNTSASHTPLHTEQVGNTSVHNTEHIRSISETDTPNNTEYVRNTSETHTEQIRNASASHTDTHTYIIEENQRLQAALNEKSEELHQKELDFIKKEAESEKLEAVIAQLNQRLEEKDALIAEQRAVISKTDDERKLLTVSLFRNNEFIEKLLRMSLTKRIFGWKNVRKELIDSQNIVLDESDVTGESG